MTPSNILAYLRRTLPFRTLVVLLGLGLFIFIVRQAGTADIYSGIANVGWGFAVILALAGLRYTLRTLSWIHCFNGPRRLSFTQAFPAILAGDAVGNITPLGLLASEPTKVFLAADRSMVGTATAALAVENFLYSLSVGVMFVLGFGAALIQFEAPPALWIMGGATLVGLLVILTATHSILWKRVLVAEPALNWSARYLPQTNWLELWLSRLKAFEVRIHDLYPRSWTGVITLTLLYALFHIAAVAEVALALALITGDTPSWLDALLLETANRFITIVFKFVPLRIGIDEAGTGAFADLLAFGATVGVTLAIVRKARLVFWFAIGIACLTRHGLSMRTFIDTIKNESPLRLKQSSADAVIAIMARSPQADIHNVKTRLSGMVPNLRDRLDLYTAFLMDSVRPCRNLTGVSTCIAYTPEGGSTGLDQLGIHVDQFLEQRGKTLGERERNLFHTLFEQGFQRVVIIGSDLPTLPSNHLTEALDQLKESNTMVIGPAEDGGYYLLGLTVPAPTQALQDLFTNIRWSTPWTMDDTVAAAARCGLRVHTLTAWYDIDDEISLRRLRKELADPLNTVQAPATTTILNRLFGLAKSKP